MSEKYWHQAINIQEVVKAVIIKEGKFLLQLRDNNPTIAYPNTWAFFGGGGWTSGRNMKKLKAGIKRGVGMVSPRI